MNRMIRRYSYKSERRLQSWVSNKGSGSDHYLDSSGYCKLRDGYTVESDMAACSACHNLLFISPTSDTISNEKVEVRRLLGKSDV